MFLLDREITPVEEKLLAEGGILYLGNVVEGEFPVYYTRKDNQIIQLP